MSYSLETSRSQQNDELIIDGVLATQPELGPSIPDGGYGWVIFAASLFFQGLVQSLSVSFGIYLCFSKLQSITSDDTYPKIWDDNFVYVPLFFTLSWTISEPLLRILIHNSTWPRLVATAATCLTCAGMLFMWMGINGTNESWIYIVSGTIAGVGASLQISQCEILVAQYFRLKHTILVHITHAVTALGYIIAPIALGEHLLKTNISNVLLWYQTVLLQGLVLALFFKKPLYLKSTRRTYNYLQHTQDDEEEDIFSKNSKELQMKYENEDIKKVKFNDEPQPGTSQNTTREVEIEKNNNWETFEDDEHKKNVNFFDEKNNSEIKKHNRNTTNWETFEDDRKNKQSVSLHEELSSVNDSPNIIRTSGVPLPLFSDFPVNNNITYAFDDVQDDAPTSNVFALNAKTQHSLFINLQLQLLKQPTFYKSLLMIVTTKFSQFVFFTLFPSYLYQEVLDFKFTPAMNFMGFISVFSLLFSGISYWINISRERRPICLWLLCWVGALGYFLISDSLNPFAFKIGAVNVVLSISALNFVGKPLLGLTYRGEQNKEFLLISLLSGLSFLFFVCFDIRLRHCFRIMAILHFSTGCIWFSNFVYKKIKQIR